MRSPVRNSLLETVNDDGRDDAQQEEISPLFSDPWNSSSPFTHVPGKVMEFFGTPQYMDYPGFSNVSY